MLTPEKNGRRCDGGCVSFPKRGREPWFRDSTFRSNDIMASFVSFVSISEKEASSESEGLGKRLVEMEAPNHGRRISVDAISRRPEFCFSRSKSELR